MTLANAELPGGIQGAGRCGALAADALSLIEGRWQLNAEVWDIAQSVVEAVGEIGGADHECQFHDLPFVVELPQFFERAGANSGGAAGDALSVKDGGLILLVKQRAALVELQRLDLLVGDADSLRRSDVRAGSILATVQQ
jgi:hypothetical protein